MAPKADDERVDSAKSWRPKYSLMRSSLSVDGITETSCCKAHLGKPGSSVGHNSWRISTGCA